MVTNVQGTSASHLSKSTEDVSRVKRDLQDCLEREADVREQEMQPGFCLR